jgi:hypothetical protein
VAYLKALSLAASLLIAWASLCAIEETRTNCRSCGIAVDDAIHHSPAAAEQGGDLAEALLPFFV